MTQITEDYCSLETAKLLKKKGFNETCEYIYEAPNVDKDCVLECMRPTRWLLKPIKNSELIDDVYTAPTLQMAMKWLREAHHCVIDITPLTFHCDGIVSKWGYCIWADDNIEVDEESSPELESYEEACEAAIKYCLENLI